MGYVMDTTEHNNWTLTCVVPNNSHELLVQVNDEKALLYLPVIVYIGFLLLVGSVGNLLVCLVYCSKSRKGSSDFFILSLAVLDMISCLVGMPTEIIDLRYPYMFSSPAACKLLRYSESATTIASAVILIQVAFDRYFRICNISKVFTSKKTRRLCLGAIVGSFVISWPTVVIFGKKTAETGIPCLVGVDCSTADEMKGTIFPKLWYGFWGLIFVVSLVFLTVLYILIGLEVWKRKSSRIGKRSPPEHKKKKEKNKESSGAGRLSSMEDSSCALSGTSPNQNKQESVRAKSTMKTNMKPRRTTLVLFAVTIAFVISFLPFLVTMILRSFITDFEKNLSHTGEVVYKFCVKSYLMNSAVNPVLYSFLNVNFRRLVAAQIRKMFPCCKRTISSTLSQSSS